MFGTCSIDVPIPCAKSPPIPFSRKLAVANPIICAQHPTVAAPAAIPDRFRITPNAAELIGSVSAIPIRTDTMIPIKNGCCSVPQRIISPICFIRSEIYGPTVNPTTPPPRIVINGVNIISSFVRPTKIRPSSIPIYAATNAPNGSPGPLKVILPFVITLPSSSPVANAPIIPALAADAHTNVSSPSLHATPIPIPAPVRTFAIDAAITIICPMSPPTNVPICSSIVPIINVANKPIAIPDKPSINILFNIFILISLYRLFLSITY